MKPTYTLQQIPNGKPGTAATLDIMSRLVRQAKKQPQIRELAIRIVSHVPNKDWVGEINAIHRWVKNNIRYTRDVRGVETLQTPVQTLRLRAGDCDDHAMLVASLLESIHHPTRLKAIGLSSANYCHVYTETKVANKWLSAETTEDVGLGWQPLGIKLKMVRHN